jgi:hypothetical protein
LPPIRLDSFRAARGHNSEVTGSCCNRLTYTNHDTLLPLPLSIPEELEKSQLCLLQIQVPRLPTIYTLCYRFSRPSPKIRSLASISVLRHVSLSFGASISLALLSTFVWIAAGLTLYMRRLLGAIERQLVMNLLWLETAVPTIMMSSWVAKDKRKCVSLIPPKNKNHILMIVSRKYDASLQVLASLHIVPASTTRLSLNPTFKSAFRQAITGGWACLFSKFSTIPFLTT